MRVAPVLFIAASVAGLSRAIHIEVYLPVECMYSDAKHSYCITMNDHNSEFQEFMTNGCQWVRDHSLVDIATTESWNPDDLTDSAKQVETFSCTSPTSPWVAFRLGGFSTTGEGCERGVRWSFVNGK